jgi:valyl-tRNA synthetase
MLQPWPAYDASQQNLDAETSIAWLKELIVAIRTIRSEANIGPSVELELLIRNTQGRDRELLAANGLFLKRLAKVNALRPLADDDETPPALSTLCKHMEILVPMAGVIDIQAELARLDKELDRQQKELTRLEGKLSNPKFIERAPETVVAAEQEKLISAKESIVKVMAQRERIAALI